MAKIRISIETTITSYAKKKGKDRFSLGLGIVKLTAQQRRDRAWHSDAWHCKGLATLDLAWHGNASQSEGRAVPGIVTKGSAKVWLSNARRSTTKALRPVDFGPAGTPLYIVK